MCGVSVVKPSCALQREEADGDDQLRAEELELPVAPEAAELLLLRFGVRSPRPVVARPGSQRVTDAQ